MFELKKGYGVDGRFFENYDDAVKYVNLKRQKKISELQSEMYLTKNYLKKIEKDINTIINKLKTEKTTRRERLELKHRLVSLKLSRYRYIDTYRSTRKEYYDMINENKKDH